MKINLALQFCKNMGLRYVTYRITHELEKKTGFLKKKFPTSIFFDKVSKEDFIINSSTFDVNSIELNKSNLSNYADLKEKSQRILSGDMLFFNAEWINLGKNYNWITNPSNGFEYDINKHWSEIPDFSSEAGDIKYVWEKSRFSWVLTLIRYDFHFKEDHGEFVFSEIESWIKNNPINMGPNWRCSQEISLRIFNWYIAISYYKNSKAFTEERWSEIQDVIFASLHHVYHHINFSRIAVRNNHAITETMFLALSDILFPFIPEAKKWAQEGRKWFEEEIGYQIYLDGTFLQFSMNYHRVVIQLLTLGISITEKAGRPFSAVVYDRAYKSVEFLYQCVQEENGWLPNYGSNDGALFFPWSDSDYRDYRPQLNSLHFLLTGENIFNSESIIEEQGWWSLKFSNNFKFKKIDKLLGIKEYPNGGYILIREEGSLTFIRCGSHKDRPAQADNLHVDIWIDGENVLKDSGTYKYNTSSDLVNYFTGTHSHNSVTVNNNSQMLKGNRFIWYYWTQKLSTTLEEKSDRYIFSGVIKAFQYLDKKGVHKRTITKFKHKNLWIIEDTLNNLDNYSKNQLWHFDKKLFNITAIEKEQEVLPEKLLSYNSDYYGVKYENQGLSFEFKEKIKTTIEIK